MMRYQLKKCFLFAFAALLFVTSCRKRDAALPDNLVNFETTDLGINENESSIEIRIKLSRSTDRDIQLQLNYTAEGLIYGTDFTTTPASADGKIHLIIPSGNNETSFTVSKVPSVLYDGDEKLSFNLYSSSSPVFIGISKHLSLSFEELVATTASSSINGGGALYPNKVFVDLSSNRQTAILRSEWDLGFYTGSDDFRVILNSSSAMMAKRLSKNDLNQVGLADTIGLSDEIAFSQFAPTIVSLPYIDYPNGDLSRTAISQIAINPNDNNVYIINRGFAPGNPAPARGWKKIRVLRNTNGGYTLQYADLAASSFQEININKDDRYFFNYISFEQGLKTIEPEKQKWDIAWTYFSNVTNFGGGEVPYLFQDIIIQNRNVEVAKVMNSAKTFADFSATNLTDGSVSLSWNNSQIAIGSDWRSGGGPGSQPAVRTDRYYIIKDGDNNYYKLRFTSLTQNGERGYPSYEIVLVKRG